MSANAYYEMCLTIFEAAIEEARAKRGSNMKPIGMAKVLTTPIDEPTELKRTRVRKICRSKCVEKLRDYLVVYSRFCAEYEAAMRLLKESISCGREYIQVRFPRGGVPPAGGYLPS